MHLHMTNVSWMTTCVRLALATALGSLVLAGAASAQTIAPTSTDEPVATETAVEPTSPEPATEPAPSSERYWLARAALAKPSPSEPAAAPSSGHDDHWHGNLGFYGFLSSVNGELRARDAVVEVDRSFGDIADVLKFAAGVRAEVQKDRWGFAFDNNYVKLGDDVTTARGLIPDYRFDLTLNVTEVEPSYRLYRVGEQKGPVGGPRFAVDVIGGVRIVHLDQDLELRRLLRPDTHLDGSATYVHGYVGNRFVASPWEHVTFEGRYNLSLASDLSWFVSGTADVRPWKHFSMGGGFQVLDLSIEEDSKDAALDARFAGPILFMRLHF